MHSYINALKKFKDFKGRTGRREYFLFILNSLITHFSILLLSGYTQNWIYTLMFILYPFFILVPTLAITVRRLHDINKSGFWILINAIPFIGNIYFLFLLLKDSYPDNNIYGPCPKAINKTDDLNLTNQNNSNDLSNSLPETIKEKSLQIKDIFKNELINHNLKSEIYIDTYKQGIKLDVIFKYGEIEIRPNNPKKLNPLIKRELSKENKILNLLKQSKFKNADDFYYLEDDERIYDFFKNTVSTLQNYSEIYFSEGINKIYKNKSISISMDLKLFASNLISLEFNIDDIDKKEIINILKSIKERKKFYKLKTGEIISLESKDIDDVISVLDVLDEFEENEIIDNKFILPKSRAITVFNKLNRDIKIENRELVDDFINKLNNSKEQNIEVPANLKTILRDYQITGFKWLKTLSNLDLGGILADDMGLGKTLQTISLISVEKDHGKTLIVAPSSLLFNWQSEFKKFAPDIKVLLVHGDKNKRKELIQEIENNDVIITSYPLLRRDIEFYENYTFNLCVLDEAQHIKNPESLNAKSTKKIKSRTRFALTGTPMENNLIELWSIFDFILPGHLYSKNKFIEKYERPITKEKDRQALEELKKAIAPFILRRKKADVLLELPDKIETKLICEMTKKQNDIYKAYLSRARKDVEDMIAKGEFETSKMQILKLLTRLRQISCHPSMFLENYDGDSGKLNQLEELLEELIEGNHKVLIFSQFTSLLHITKAMLDNKKIKYSYLDGSTNVSKRMQIVDEFNNGKTDVFLISLKAGGTGLNLTTADTVILLDPWWNPAVEEQAADRAHRIGQKNVVQVFKMITKGSIEEKIYELQIKKKELIDSVIKNGEVFINSLTEKEILEILQ